MATSDWSSSYNTDGGSSPRRAPGSLASVSPIALSTDISPMDSGNSSPKSPTAPHNGSLHEDTLEDISDDVDQTAKYKEEIKELRKQIKQLQDVGNYRDDTESNDLRKKLAQCDDDHANKTRSFNEEITSLHSQLAKSRAAVERGEATRQKLEYDLTIANRIGNQEKRAAAEREAVMQKSISNLKETILQQRTQVKELENSLQTAKELGKNEEKSLKEKIALKDKMILELRQEVHNEEEEKRKLHIVVQEQESLYSELEEKCSSLEVQRASQGDAIQKQLNELEFSSEREDRLKKEIQQYQDRVKILEESIEAERAAHLETKFNSEIVQLKVRDLEGALEVEKSALDEVKHNMEMLTKQHRELESAFEDERDALKMERAKVVSLEQTSADQKKRLSGDVEEKQNIITNLSKQLEVHQKNFDALKTELTQARKRQIQLDTTYGSSMRELELLLDNFQVEKSEERKKHQGHKRDKAKPLSPAVVLESLRHTLADYQNRCSNASAELKKFREIVEKLSSDCGHYKEMVVSRDKAMKEADKTVANTSKELARAKTDCAEKEANIAALKVKIQKLNKALDEKQDSVQAMEEEKTKLKSVFTSEDESHRVFLHTLYQRLITGKVYVSSPDAALSRYSWSDMSNLVSEQVSALLSEMNRANERVEHLENMAANREEAQKQTQETHEQTVAKLSTAIKEREHSWKKQRAEIEEHYSNLIRDLHTRTQKSQSLAEEAWEKAQQTGHVKENLELQNVKFQEALDKYQSEKDALVCACALLSGALWPAFARIQALSTQRNVLSEYLKTLESLREQTQSLGEMLSSELDHEGKAERSRSRCVYFRDGRQPVLVFRAAVIAVIAANRLNHLSFFSSRAFALSESPGELAGMSVVCSGGVSRVKVAFKGLVTSLREDPRDRSGDHPGVTSASAWLTSPQLESHVIHAMSELQDVLRGSLDMFRQEGHDDRGSRASFGASTSTSAVISAARTAYSKLLSRLQPEFATLTAGEDPWQSRYGNFRSDLISSLGMGLTNWVERFENGGRVHVASQKIVNGLQNHILGFTQRLHTAEVDRRSLRFELNKAKQDYSEVKSALSSNQSDHRKAKESMRTIETRLQETKEEMLTMVPVSRFDSVCDELNNALKREQQAQSLLNEQTSQMQEIGARLEIHATQGEEKDATLEEAVKGLSEAKMHLRRQEHAVRQLNKQMSHLEGEKKAMAERVGDAEKALHATAREKELLIAYLKSVDKALEESKDQIRLSQSAVGPWEFTLPQVILPRERLAIDGVGLGPEMVACQNIVNEFMVAQQQALDRISSLEKERQQALSRMVTLEEEVASHKAHIVTLKKELAAACRRQMSEDGFSDNGTHGTRDGFSLRDSSTRPFADFREGDSYRNDFVPLSAHWDSSGTPFRPSLASTGSHSERSKGSYLSPKRRSSSRRRQAK